MSCGLGAIILVFMLVKYNAETTTDENVKLQAETQKLTSQEELLKKALADAQAMSEQELKQIQSIRAEIQRIHARVAESESSIEEKKARVAGLEQAIESSPRYKASDIVENKNAGEEEYLLGLRVEGDRIGFLLDSSASMTEEKLIDIIRLKSGLDKAKQQGAKWLRTQRVMRWLLARLPKEAKASVVSFNKSAKFLGSSQWFSANDVGQIKEIQADIDKIVPTGPTNLHQGLQKIETLNPQLTDLYIITDGLPTTGISNYAGLNLFSKCTSLIGQASTISGECRVKLFRQTVRETSFSANVKVNIILLPIEGDPEAAPELWAWTSMTGGLLISPAESWP